AYTYDTLNRQVFIDYPGSAPDVTKRYDADGHLTKLTNSHAVIDQRYDENDNLIEKVLTLDGVPYALTFTYDALDGLATLTYPSGRVVDYLPDAFGRPTQAAPYLSGVSYHPSGQLARINYANGELTDITLNERQWISEFLHHGLAELHYAYDALGNVLGLSDPLNPAEDRAFGHDALNRLTSAQGRWGAGSFEYDAFGNLTLMTQGAESHVLDYNALRLRSVIHNNATRSWYAHDAYGNVRSDTEILGTGTSGSLLKDQQYVYDDAGHLRSVPVSQYLGGTLSISTHSFDYDAAGNRMRRTGPNGEVTGFVYGRTGQLLGEYTGATTYGKEYIYLGSHQIASAETNAPPVADAGADRDANIGQVVTLDGSQSSDPDGSIASYAWTQVSATAVSLTAADTARPTFTAPSVAVDTTVSFQLTVTDSDLDSASDTVSVRISANRAPIAAAGPDQRVVAGQTVVLDGSGSSDPDGSSLTYLWTQTAGYGVTLDDRTKPKPAFTLATSSTAATLQFKLTVTDPSGLSASDTVAIAVLDLIADGDNDGLPDGWEIIHFGSTSLYDGSADPDGDGLTNAQEYADGTDPLTPEPAPTAVSDLWAVPGEGEITLDWTPVPAAVSYDLYWSTSPGVTPLNGNKLTKITRPYIHTGLSNGTSYYYIVVATNNSGAAPASMEVSATPGTRSWQAAIPIGSAEDMAVTTRGERMLIWQTGKTLWARYYRGSWRAPQALHAGAGPVGDPKIALDERGHAMAVWREHDGTRWNLWSRIYQIATGVWDSPVLVETYNGSVYEK
ncbi:MAG: PKD domain-containing protein, partial [Gammaproteobacteria bacterium]